MMEKERLVYKLYKDTEVKPTKDLYIKPLLVGTGSLIGMIGSCFLTPDTPLLIGASAGLTGLFLGKGFVNVCVYKKQKENYKLQLGRLEKFKEEAKKIVGKDINIDSSDVVVTASFTGFGMNAFNIIGYKDNSQLLETIGKNPKCFYYDVAENREIDITSAKDIAYSIKK